MKQPGLAGRIPLNQSELYTEGTIFRNLTSEELIQQAVRRKEGLITSVGALLVTTGKHTGRAARDKYFVKRGEPIEAEIAWGELNKPISPEAFNRLHQKLLDYFSNRDVFIQQGIAGAHPAYHFPIEVVTDTAWQNLSVLNLIRSRDEYQLHELPEYTILAGIECKADPTEDNTRSDTFICIDFSRKLILIGGSGYAGEIKKALFTALHLEYPRRNILSMHCSANAGSRGDVALFFGLSGTGKTSLSSDPARMLIGDDEHAWNEDGVFNLEGGCYAKTLNLDPKWEPLIWGAVNQRGTVIENAVTFPKTNKIDFTNNQITENCRASYPLNRIENYLPRGQGDHPKNIFFLSADAFGVLPPISRLTPEQSEYFFLAGYTAKLAGTEDGLGKEPKATFSACFALPFLPLNPRIYANMLREKITLHQTNIWLVNTGWTGGGYGRGSRIAINHTRRLISAALEGELNEIEYEQEPYFGLYIPCEVYGLPEEILNPVNTWGSIDDYAKQAKALADSFQSNLEDCL
jgi:phosphoenolpyruvate carboxykinase (ATP)